MPVQPSLARTRFLGFADSQNESLGYSCGSRVLDCSLLRRTVLPWLCGFLSELTNRLTPGVLPVGSGSGCGLTFLSYSAGWLSPIRRFFSCSPQTSTAVLTEPVLNLKTRNPAKVRLIISNYPAAVGQGRSGNQNVRVGDQLSSLVKVGINICRLNYDLVVDWKNAIPAQKCSKRSACLRAPLAFKPRRIS